MNRFHQHAESTLGDHFLSSDELSIIAELIHSRHTLPSFHGDCWKCYECGFEASSIAELSDHLHYEHESNVYNEEDLVEEGLSVLH